MWRQEAGSKKWKKNYEKDLLYRYRQGSLHFNALAAGDSLRLSPSVIYR